MKSYKEYQVEIALEMAKDIHDVTDPPNFIVRGVPKPMAYVDEIIKWLRDNHDIEGHWLANALEIDKHGYHYTQWLK